jgi:DNA polymerase I-like protein with 3'-5' exonuclease and polymerase domains
VEYGGLPYGDGLDLVRSLVEHCDLLVGFNLKRDLHWLRRYGIKHPPTLRVYCCQLGKFLLSSQLVPYPSLEQVSMDFGLGGKLDVVKCDYWDNGIDTDRIPWSVLEEYALDDVIKTRQVYDAQQILISQRSPAFQRLVLLDNEDMLSLVEMEWNGLKYDVNGSRSAQQKQEEELNAIDIALGNCSDGWSINWASGDQLSAVLYGGTLRRHVPAEVGVYKTGPRAGTPKWGHVVEEKVFPQLVKPTRKLKKDGVFATDEDTLKALPAKGMAKKIVELILRRAKIEKLMGTYLKGIPDRIEEMEWTDHIVHGKYNQTVAVTSRLSSSEPNLQNNPPEVDKFFVSRYAD